MLLQTLTLDLATSVTVRFDHSCAIWQRRPERLFSALRVDNANVSVIGPKRFFMTALVAAVQLSQSGHFFCGPAC
jgi:hypothetical protein